MSDIIIIVDKKPFLADTLEMVISNYFPHQFTILAFDNSTSAFNTIEELSIKKEKISLISCEFEMPNITGFEFLNLTTTFSPDSVKVLTTTYIEMKKYQELLSNSDVDFILEKPFNINSLVNVVKCSLIQQHLLLEKQKNLETIQSLKNSLSLMRNKYQIREDNFLTISDSLNAFYFRLDLKNTLFNIYTKSTDFFGYETSSFHDFDSFLSIVAPDDQAKLIESIKKIKVDITSLETIFLHIITKKQSPLPVKIIMLKENSSESNGRNYVVGIIQPD